MTTPQDLSPQTRYTGPADSWSAGFSLALAISTVTLFSLVFGMLALRVPLDLFSRGHRNPTITSCVITPDGRHALVTCRLQTLDDAATSALLVSLDLRGKQPYALRLPTDHPDQELAGIGKRGVAVAANTKWIERRNIRSGERQPGFQLDHDRAPESMAVSPDGRWLVTSDRNLRVVDLQQQSIAWERNDLRATNIAISPQGTLICVLDNTELVEISLERREVMRTIARCKEDIFTIAVDPRGMFVACLFTTGRVELRRLGDGGVVWTRAAHGLLSFPVFQRPEVLTRAICFSPDGRDLVTTASEEGWVIVVWDVETGERVQTLRGHDQCIVGVTYLADGTLVSWSCDGTLRFWDVPRGYARKIISLKELLSC